MNDMEKALVNAFWKCRLNTWWTQPDTTHFLRSLFDHVDNDTHLAEGDLQRFKQLAAELGNEGRRSLARYCPPAAYVYWSLKGVLA